MKPVIMIAGPTASGKSALAIHLAKRLGGEVINADSMQVYSDLCVISARPRQSEMQGIPHHFFGHIDGAVRYSVGAWVREAVPAALECLARDKYPILVGGTGLYFKALTDGLSNIPAIPDLLLQKLKERLDQDGFDVLHREAVECDPAATSRLLGEDPQRLLRILSVYQHTGRPLSVWQQNTRPIIPQGFWKGIFLNPPREELYRKIDSRFEAMIQQGGRQEVDKILSRNLDRGLPVMKAIGVSQSFEAEGSDWIKLCQRDTRRLAKRQKTFFRKSAANWVQISRFDHLTALILENFIIKD